MNRVICFTAVLSFLAGMATEYLLRPPEEPQAIGISVPQSKTQLSPRNEIPAEVEVATEPNHFVQPGTVANESALPGSPADKIVVIPQSDVAESSNHSPQFGNSGLSPLVEPRFDGILAGGRSLGTESAGLGAVALFQENVTVRPNRPVEREVCLYPGDKVRVLGKEVREVDFGGGWEPFENGKEYSVKTDGLPLAPKFKGETSGLVLEVRYAEHEAQRRGVVSQREVLGSPRTSGQTDFIIKP